MSTLPGKTVLDVIHATTSYFQQHRIEEPRLTIELMLADVLKKKRLQLYLELERTLDEPTLVRLREMVKRRVNREPLQYILGKTDFFGLELQLDSRVLIPRPETEILVEQVIAACKDAGITRILDVGTGSGCIAISLARNLPAAIVTAADRSANALQLAQVNAQRLGVMDRIEFVESDLFRALGQRTFDWIVSNPPYIPTGEAGKLEKEIIDYEPLDALFAGEDGLTIIRSIIAEAPRFLASAGHVALEIGAGQSE